MATKKRSDGGEGSKPAPRKAASKTSTKASTRPKPAPRIDEDDLGTGTPVAPRVVKAAVKTGAKKAATTRPKLRASHSAGPSKAGPRTSAARGKAAPVTRARTAAPAGKTPLAVPKRQGVRKAIPPETPSAARELAVSIASAGLDKKAVGVEILDVRGRVDYADFLVIMTGRSDRHVASIAQGIEEELGKKKIVPISTEGLPAASWVLLDYADVVVHVFQEDARQLYDIEGLWMDASRVSVPNAEGEGAKQQPVTRTTIVHDEEE